LATPATCAIATPATEQAAKLAVEVTPKLVKIGRSGLRASAISARPAVLTAACSVPGA
jgi:hypothetical protein